MLKKKICLFLLTATVVSCFVGCSDTSSKNTTTQMEASLTTEYTVKRDDISVDLSLSGSVKSSKTTTVTGGSGTIEEICVSSNEEVIAGEDLIVFDTGYVVEAPFDGKITKIYVSEGDEVDASTQLVNVSNNTSYKIETSVSEDDISNVKVGQNVTVSVSALNKEYSGIVTSVDGEATSSGNSVAFGVVIELQDDVSDLYSGMSSELTIKVSESTDALVVPVDAVKKSKDGYVVSVKKDDKTTDVSVEIGIQNASYVEVLSGLEEGDIVVYTKASKTSSASGSNMNSNRGSDMGGQGFDKSQMMNMNGGQPPTNISGGTKPTN